LLDAAARGAERIQAGVGYPTGLWLWRLAEAGSVRATGRWRRSGKDLTETLALLTAPWRQCCRRVERPDFRGSMFRVGADRGSGADAKNRQNSFVTGAEFGGLQHCMLINSAGRGCPGAVFAVLDIA